MGGSTAATEQQRSPWRSPPRLWGMVISLLLAAVLLIPLPAGSSQAWAWTLPGQQQRPSTSPLAPTSPGGRLQESAPPLAVQQLQEVLAEHLPQVEVVSPRDGALLPDGPWTLRARVSDWPLADAGELGLGAHVVVQIDDQPAQVLAGSAEALALELPALRPGSHRISVYAVKPWGEVVKSPGAISQIRVHRVAANPLQVPAPGSPQLLAVSPGSRPQGEPVLLDWILLDAPLQNLRPGDGSWRLRVSVNGDSFLVDQNVPLWLKGWRPGSNSLLLELVDGLGAPLNPPFNSLVQEVTLSPVAAERPRWLNGRLSEQELDLLLGRVTPAQLAATETSPAIEEEEEPAPEPDHAEAQTAAESTNQADGETQTTGSGLLSEQTTENETSQAEPISPAEALGSADQEDSAEALNPQNSTSEATEDGSSDPLDEVTSSDQEAQSSDSAPSQAPERSRSSTPLEGTARDLVNADGSLIQPRPAGPLSGLRQRFSS